MKAFALLAGIVLSTSAMAGIEEKPDACVKFGFNDSILRDEADHGMAPGDVASAAYTLFSGNHDAIERAIALLPHMKGMDTIGRHVVAARYCMANIPWSDSGLNYKAISM
jgi:hypothetical protein